jgi:hypothetical protein
VVGDAHVWVCLPASRTTPVSVRRLQSGDRIDLAGPTQTLVARSRTPNQETLASATQTPER